MYRSSWEIATHVRHHIADLTTECQGFSPIDRTNGRAGSLLTQLRIRLGVGLIRAGRALVGSRGVDWRPGHPIGSTSWNPGL